MPGQSINFPSNDPRSGYVSDTSSFYTSFSIPRSTNVNGTWRFAWVYCESIVSLYPQGDRCNGWPFIQGTSIQPGNSAGLYQPNTTFYVHFTVATSGYATFTNTSIELVEWDAPSVYAGVSQSICPGTSVRLPFGGQGLASATVDQGIGSLVIQDGNNGSTLYACNDPRVVTPTVPTTYTITGVGMGGEVVTASVDIRFKPPPITAGVTWESSCSGAGGKIPFLNWSCTDAYVQQIDIYIGASIYKVDAGLSGRLAVTQAPGTSTTYTFVASRGGCTPPVPTNVIVQQPAWSGYIDAGAALFTALVSTSLCSPSLTGVPPAPKSLAALSLTQDATRRPAVGGGASSVTGYVSKDAGHTYLTTTLDASGTDASLLIDTRRNRFRVIYSKASALVQAAGEVRETFVLDAGGPVALTGMGGGAAPTGAYPVAVPHPADKDFTLLAYLSGGVLWSAGSNDGGVSWRTQAAIATGLDFTPTGRAALAMIGESAFIAYASGSNLFAAAGADRGNSWTAPLLTATGGPYTGLSLLAFQGRLYLLAFTGSTPAPVLFVSPDLGATWAQVSSTFPAITPPSGIGVVPTTGRLRLGLTHFSGDDGHTWIAA